MQHPLDPSDGALLRPFIGSRSHRAICKTSKVIAPSHSSTRYIQHSSADAPPHVNVDRGPVSYSLVNVSVS